MSERQNGETNLHSSPSRAVSPTRRELLRAAARGVFVGLALIGALNLIADVVIALAPLAR